MVLTCNLSLRAKFKQKSVPTVIFSKILKLPYPGHEKVQAVGHFKKSHLQGMKKLGTCPAARKFQLLPRMISRLVHGNEVEFHARHENLNFMPGMKLDDIDATVRKQGCISCPA